MADGRTVTIGDRHVRRLGYGTMQLTGPGVWGPPADRDGAIAVLRRAVDLGVELIDTADSYGPEVAEVLVRDALAPYADEVFIATKAGLERPGPGEWVPNGDPGHLRRCCEASLARLGVDRIDLFQLHRIDPAVAAEDQFGLLAELRAEGKVADVGLSEVTVEDVRAAQAIVPIASVQNEYHLGRRGADELLALCEQDGIAFVPWFPLASGRLSQPGSPIEGVAAELGATTSQVALAWLLHRSAQMAPIPGTSSVSHVEENCAAADLVLTDEQFDRLDGDRKAMRRWALGG